jgi:hypothetical protein
MIWAAWRQQRTETLIAVGILGLLAAVLVPTGIEMASAYHHAGLSACVGQTTSESCGNALDSFLARFNSIGGLAAWFTLVPGLIGALLAAPFLLELENGTYRLAWTQSITRGRWIATKVGLMVGAAIVAAVALTLLTTWWRASFVHINGRMENSAFDSEGTVALGYTLFALGVALAVGVVWRRAVAALVVAFAAYAAARIFVDTWLRQRYLSPNAATWRVTLSRVPGLAKPKQVGHPPANLHHAWVFNQYPSDRFGHHVATLGGPCVRGVGAAVRCAAPQGVLYTHAVYQPASRFWAFQGIETALFGGVAVMLIVFASWWTHRRTS